MCESALPGCPDPELDIASVRWLHRIYRMIFVALW